MWRISDAELTKLKTLNDLEDTYYGIHNNFFTVIDLLICVCMVFVYSIHGIELWSSEDTF